MEKARIQLAIAIAAEAKFTPVERRKYYLDTADQMRKFIKQLRSAGQDESPTCEQWRRALERIKQLPAEGRALELCRILRKILEGGA